jgi:hypothetical protein
MTQQATPATDDAASEAPAAGRDRPAGGRGIRGALALAFAFLLGVGATTEAVESIATTASRIWPGGVGASAPAPDELNVALPAVDTPNPGAASSRLGFGDSEGGRALIVYTPDMKYLAEPALNTITDTTTLSDERAFVGARWLSSATDASTKRLYERYVDARERPYVAVRFVLSNNADADGPCDVTTGPTAVRGVRVRGAVSDAGNGRHVLRIWVLFSTDTQPDVRWITDAVVVDIPDGASLAHLPDAASVYRQLPRTATRLTKAEELFTSGGMELLDGSVGPCWENRLFGLLKFEVRRS